MVIGSLEILEDFKRAELAGINKRVLELDNVSHHTEDFPKGFHHVPVGGNLEVEVTSQGIMITANVEEVRPRNPSEQDPERIKRMINSAYKAPVTAANDYCPGKRITLYSYPDHQFPGWSFHCKLPEAQ